VEEDDYMVEFVLGLLGVVDCRLVAIVEEVPGCYEAIAAYILIH
jgi:hypothetical protein